MGKRPGYHDLFIRTPDELWKRFTEFVGTLSPKRTVTQQIVWLMEANMAGEVTPEKVNFDVQPRKVGRPAKKKA